MLQYISIIVQLTKQCYQNIGVVQQCYRVMSTLVGATTLLHANDGSEAHRLHILQAVLYVTPRRSFTFYMSIEKRIVTVYLVRSNRRDSQVTAITLTRTTYSFLWIVIAWLDPKCRELPRLDLSNLQIGWIDRSILPIERLHHDVYLTLIIIKDSYACCDTKCAYNITIC